MSSPAFLYERDVAVPMGDGTRLNAVLFRPVEGAAPTLVVRTPYGATAPLLGLGGNAAGFPNATAFVDAGYAVVWVECRGTFSSDGTFRPAVDDAKDGYDTIDWVAQQLWCDGSVGMYGASYLGMTQWAVATQAHPALKAIAPMLTAVPCYQALWHSPGGALSLSALTTWHTLMALNADLRGASRGEGDLTSLGDLVAGLRDQLALNDPSPVSEHPLLAGRQSFDEVVAHPDFDDYWAAQDLTTGVEKVTAPVLAIAGWYDPFMAQQLRDFERVITTSGSEQVRQHSRLVVGPWDHDPGLTGLFRDHAFGQLASSMAADITGEHIRHFDQWLRAPDVPPAPRARVRLFVMGVNEWRDLQDWPPPQTSPVELFLGDQDPSSPRRGELTAEPYTSDRMYEYTYDPADPVPTTGGAHIPTTWGFSGPADQRVLDDRSDILSFETAPLDEPLEIIGYVSASLFVRSDALDTDFTAKLIDVHPDGTALNLCDGILRMRYRHDLRAPQLMEPGKAYEISIDMTATAAVLLPGHRLRVDIASSNFPHYDRNTNTGGAISKEGIDAAVAARNTVLVGPRYPSRIVLPVYRAEPE